MNKRKLSERARSLMEQHGKIMRAYRKSAGFSLREVEEAVGLDFSLLSCRERGGSPFPIGDIMRLCQLYGKHVPRLALIEPAVAILFPWLDAAGVTAVSCALWNHWPGDSDGSDKRQVTVQDILDAEHHIKAAR